MALSETSDNYPYVVAVLNHNTRVIECVARIQWIIQKRQHRTKWPWEGVSFCRTKEALVRLAGFHPVLLALPDRFQEPGQSGGDGGDSEKSCEALCDLASLSE